jgi:uncharacterized protein
MRVTATILLALALTPMVGAEPSFDCLKAQSAAEKRVCNDKGLQWSDRQLARLYTLALKEATEAGRAALIESQRRFLAERDACGTVPLGCVEQLYHRRLQELATRVNVHDAYAMFVRANTGALRIVRFGFTGAVDLWATGENGHECTFEEDDLLQTGKGLLRFKAKVGDEACRMNIIPDGDNVRVEIEEGCRFYCGHRAHMDGTYTRVN